jgi:hypothetical protein
MTRCTNGGGHAWADRADGSQVCIFCERPRHAQEHATMVALLTEAREWMVERWRPTPNNPSVLIARIDAALSAPAGTGVETPQDRYLLVVHGDGAFSRVVVGEAALRRAVSDAYFVQPLTAEHVTEEAQRWAEITDPDRRDIDHGNERVWSWHEQGEDYGVSIYSISETSAAPVAEPEASAALPFDLDTMAQAWATSSAICLMEDITDLLRRFGREVIRQQAALS